MYWPVCNEWQIMKCRHLGLNHIRDRHFSEPQYFSRFHIPQARGRMQGDGNCFFRALALLITGSQEDHTELRALITTYITMLINFHPRRRINEPIFQKIQDGHAYCLGIRNRNLRSCTNIADIYICVCQVWRKAYMAETCSY